MHAHSKPIPPLRRLWPEARPASAPGAPAAPAALTGAPAERLSGR
ncbi:none [Sorangium cellulosum So ce56]|uniref:None n=1 Tax=Sorangium cellulosum (strain So ce56) TaxID=448385 RepID=A9FGV2_SORC5|nr:none [Sorangium cellulosum So ce56]